MRAMSVSYVSVLDIGLLKKKQKTEKLVFYTTTTGETLLLFYISTIDLLLQTHKFYDKSTTITCETHYT